MKFKNGRDIKEGDEVVGVDHCNRPCAGVAVAGIKAHLQDDLVFKNNVHGAVQPSLHLNNFLHAEDAAEVAAEKKSKPAASTAK